MAMVCGKKAGIGGEADVAVTVRQVGSGGTEMIKVLGCDAEAK